jgi:ribosome-binding protein aMBF1 (putative translation factor)
MQQNTPKKIESNLIQSLLSTADPMESRRTRNRMLMAVHIQDAMKLQKISKKQLAEKLGKSPSIVTKYLSGTQNLTMDTLSDLESILGISFLQTELNVIPISVLKTNGSFMTDVKVNQSIREKIMA